MPSGQRRLATVSMQTSSLAKCLIAACRVLGVSFMETSLSISELVRRCSESSRQYYEGAVRDLDRRVGASLAAIRDQRQSPSSQPTRLSNGIDDLGKSLAVSATQE